MPLLTSPLDPADLTQVVDYLKDGGDPADPDLALPEVSTDASTLNLPGVWIAIRGIEQRRLGGVDLDLVAYVLSPDLEDTQAWPILADLWNRVTALITPSGPTTPETVALPDVPAGVPALAIPFTFETCVEA